MQIIKVSDGQGQAEYYADFELAFRRWLELDGEEVSFEVLDVIEKAPAEGIPLAVQANKEL